MDPRELAREAIPYLRQAFGEECQILLRLQSTEEGPLYKMTVHLLPQYDRNPDQALRQFEETWWLDNCHRSEGNLVFDYEKSA